MDSWMKQIGDRWDETPTTTRKRLGPISHDRDAEDVVFTGDKYGTWRSEERSLDSIKKCRWKTYHYLMD